MSYNKEVARSWYVRNSQKKMAYAKAYYAAHRDERLVKAHEYIIKRRISHPGYWCKSHRQKRYGLDEVSFQRLMKVQEGKCAICCIKFDENEKVLKPHIDHDHVSGKVRGLLCQICNISLGVLEKPGFLDAALRYLGAR